jgi:hypothetical protein
MPANSVQGELSTRLSRVLSRQFGEKSRTEWRAIEAQQELHLAIKDHPEEFVKPRTRLLHGIKFGYQKRKGEIAWEDEAKVVALIRKHFPEQEEILIKIVETPVKKALGQLAAADLKKLGVSVENDTDEVIIKATDSDIDQIVEAILKTETE